MFVNLKSLSDISYGIQDVSDLMSSIDLEQFEKLFLDNLNGEVNDDNFDEVYMSTVV